MKKYFTIQLFTSCRINTESIVSDIRCTLKRNKTLHAQQNCLVEVRDQTNSPFKGGEGKPDYI
jgi:hypothetical protein